MKDAVDVVVVQPAKLALVHKGRASKVDRLEAYVKEEFRYVYKIQQLLLGLGMLMGISMGVMLAKDLVMLLGYHFTHHVPGAYNQTQAFRHQGPAFNVHAPVLGKANAVHSTDQEGSRADRNRAHLEDGSLIEKGPLATLIFNSVQDPASIEQHHGKPEGRTMDMNNLQLAPHCQEAIDKGLPTPKDCRSMHYQMVINDDQHLKSEQPQDWIEMIVRDITATTNDKKQQTHAGDDQGSNDKADEVSNGSTGGKDELKVANRVKRETDVNDDNMPSKDFKGKKKTGTESLLDTIFAHLPSAQNIYKPTTPGITRGDDNINLVKRASGEGGAQKKVTNKEDKIKKYAKQIDFIHERMIDDLADQAYEQHMAAVANELGPLCDGRDCRDSVDSGAEWNGENNGRGDAAGYDTDNEEAGVFDEILAGNTLLVSCTAFVALLAITVCYAALTKIRNRPMYDAEEKDVEGAAAGDQENRGQVDNRTMEDGAGAELVNN